MFNPNAVKKEDFKNLHEIFIDLNKKIIEPYKEYNLTSQITPIYNKDDLLRHG